MLVDVVENGYGKEAGVPGYYVAGKTGTAQVAGPDGKYIANDNIGSFIGFAPVENPQFVMLIRIDHPRDAAFRRNHGRAGLGQTGAVYFKLYGRAAESSDPCWKVKSCGLWKLVW